MMREFWAHSDPIQLLASHLRNVAVVAECLAKSAAPEEAALHTMAHLAGLLHDYGKYTECFQQRIRGAAGRCPHSIHGAIAVRQFGLRPGSPLRHWAMPVVHAIAAHHGGLRNHADLDLLTRPSNPSPEPKQRREKAMEIWKTALTDQPAIRTALLAEAPGRAGGTKDLLTRILLSCLVDADRLDSAGRQPTQAPLEATERLNQLMLHLDTLKVAAEHRGGGNATVLEVRQQVQQLCHDAAQGDARLLSLAVPTGGGKTLAAMRFALESAAAHPDDYRRIIVVIPYLSIIEQNAEVYRKVFGDDAIFEHHSGAVYALKQHGEQFTPSAESDTDPTLPLKRLETENWDAPVIVTTSVRFFESLFSNHPSDLRRVHNIARSIIVLDEVQTLPRRLLAPLLDMLRELTEDWGCTVVMATATQPAFEVNAASARKTHERYAWPAGTVTPIIPPAISAEMHTSLRRVQIEWRIDEPTPWSALAAEMLTHPQALCVVNLRKHAAQVYDELLAQSDEPQHEGIFHLSTRMCAQHRLDVLAVIRERLATGKVCRVVSTQLIEAGVDVDFPIAFRALGPLDAIIQVAGRVDREGRLTAAAGKPAGRLVVFQSEDRGIPPEDYAAATGITESLAMEWDIQTDNLEMMQRYFEGYYSVAGDKGLGKALADMRADDKLQFEQLANAFEFINSRTKDVFVSYGEATQLLLDLKHPDQLKDWRLLRKLQRYSVGLQPSEFEEARRSRTIYEAFPGSDVWVSGEGQYDSTGRGLLQKLYVGGTTV